MIALMLFGGISVSRMGVSLLPDVDYPQVQVSIKYEGASPELIETDVTDIVEGALVGVSGVRNLYSSSKYGSSNVTLEFDLSRNIDSAIQDVQTALQAVTRNLPDEIDPPLISKSNPEDRPILWLALSADVPLRELMKYARNSLKDRFTSVEGVSDINLGGYLEPQVRVWLDPAKLAQYELTAGDVIAAIQTEHKEIPAGRILQDKSEINLRVLGEATTPEELAKIRVTRGASGPLYRTVSIGELGRVESGLEDIRRFSRSNGVTAVGIGIKKQPGSNSLSVAALVKERAASLKLPPGYKVSVNFDNTVFIKAAIDELKFTMLLSILLTALVCYLFLGSLSSTINILFAIPTSLLGTFIFMAYFGFTLNYFTMLALILVVGIVVDDAIMVLENIARHQEMGFRPFRAAVMGSEQILSPAVATSLAIVAVFLPVIFVDGLTGAYLFQFGVTLCVAVLLSLLEAVTFTPMRLSTMKLTGELKGLPGKFDALIRRTSKRYKKGIEWSLQRPWLIYGLSTGLFAFSIFTATRLPKEFTPEEDTGAIMARAELPLGTSFAETNRRLQLVEEVVLKDTAVQRVFSMVGGFGGDVNTGIIFITLKDISERKKRSQKSVQEDLKSEFKKLGDGLTVRMQNAGGGGFGGRRGYAIELSLRGSDWKELTHGAQALQGAMAKDPAFSDVDSSYKEGVPELTVLPKRDAALARGVSVEALSETLNFVYNGIRAGKFNDDGRRVDITVEAEEKNNSKAMSQLSKLFVRNNRGQLIPLGEVATFKESKSVVAISRENRERSIDVYSNVGKTYAQDKAIERAFELSKGILPPTVTLATSGSSAELSKTFKSLGIALFLGILVAYMVLASQYNSYVHPITVLLALPFSLTGAFFALYLGGASLNVYSMIGLLLLMGIVKKNSILLVEFANEYRKEHPKATLAQAIAESGGVRLRPILMTSFATAAAALPPAIGLGHSSASTQPMALCILGGTIVSTALTLFVVPVAYVHLGRLEKHLDPKEIDPSDLSEAASPAPQSAHS